MTELRFAYTVAQVAEGFGRSELTIRRWIKAGRLKAVRIGGTWYIRPASLTPCCIRRLTTMIVSRLEPCPIGVAGAADGHRLTS
jgi:excisionase family DNA binding protein